MGTNGCIYILTNPSFPEYVKIGYAANVKQRLDELNRSSAVPFSFRIYATYEVDSNLSDKKLHSILDKLNPELRSREVINGKTRTREFYAMTPEDAYSILEAIAEINNYSERLKKWKETAEQKKDEQLANEISEEHKERLAPFSFTKCGIPVKSEICFIKDKTKVCYVVDDRHVEYNGITMSLTALARDLLQTTNSIAGPMFFTYKGERLVDIRYRLGV